MAREYLFRRNAVLEALHGQRRTLYKLYVQAGLPKREVAPFLHAARARNLAVEETDKQKLGNLAGDSGHQGVVLEVGSYPYASIDAMIGLAQQRGEQPFLLALDLVQGPHNVGMLIRSAEACGVHGIIIQDRRAPEINPGIVAAAAGATEHLLIAQVTNLNRAFDELKRHDVWIVGATADAAAQRLDQIDLNRPLALVIGHEGSGLRRQVQQNCDMLVRIPMRGHVESLNAAASGAILLYAAWQARGYAGDADVSAAA